MRRINLALFLVAIILPGCLTAHVKPREPIPIPMERVPQLPEGLSVQLINDQPVIAEQIIALDSFGKLAANYNEWTQFFVLYWEKELKKRGVKVSENSPNKIYVKLDKLAYSKPLLFLHLADFTITLRNQDSSWERHYLRYDESANSIHRVYASLIHNSVAKLMQNNEVIDQMRH